MIAAVLATIVAALVFSPASLAAVQQDPPTVDPAESWEGMTLNCLPGDVTQSSGPVTTTYEWYDVDSGEERSADESQYVVERGDVRKEIGCKVTRTDDDGPHTAESGNGSQVVQRAIVRAALLSPTVSGDIGMDVPGVTVTVGLIRDDTGSSAPVRRVVGQKTTTTGADGTWSITLDGVAPSTGRDGVVVDYTGDPGSVPADAEFSGRTLDISDVGNLVYRDGSGQTVDSGDADTVQFFCMSCERLGVSLNGGPFTDAMPGGFGLFEFDPAAPILQSDRLVAREHYVLPSATQTGEPVVGVLERSMRQIGSNEWTGPTCQADVATSIIRCRGAVRPADGGNPYVLRLNDGPDVATRFGTFGGELLTEGNRNHGDFVTGLLPGVKTGDTVKLVRTDTGQTLTSLKVGRLRVHIAEDGKVTGLCQPGTWLDIWRQDDSVFKPVCPADGEMDERNYGFFSYDDFSGGRTEARLPEIVDPVPAAGATVQGAVVPFKAATRFYADEIPGYLSTDDPVRVVLAPQGGGGTIEVANVNTANGAPVTLPASGRYDARWTVTDRNGDTRTIVTSFTADVPPGGAPGGPGAPGTAPAFAGRLKIKPKRFRAAKRGAPVATIAKRKGKRKAPIGTTVRYRLTAAAGVTFAVQRKLKGRRSGGSCVKQTKLNRQAKKCKRIVVLGTFTHAGAAGANAFRFTGRLAGKRLKKGRYTLVGVAGAAGPGASTKRRKFRIVR